MLAKLFTVILYLTVQQVNVDAYTDLNHTCFANGTIEVYNPNSVLYTNILAVQSEGLSNATICATTTTGAQHTITNCSQDSPIVVFFSNRTAGYLDILGSDDAVIVSYQIQCDDLEDTGVNRTVSNKLSVTLEVSTQATVTPSFVVTSDIKDSVQGSSVTISDVGDTVYWTIDVPANYTAKATCDAYSGTSTSGTPSKRLVTNGCSDDDDLLSGNFNTTTSINSGLDTRYSITMYTFKFYNSDYVYFHCVVTVCPTGSSTCDITGCTYSKRSVDDVQLGPEDQVFKTGTLLHVVSGENGSATISGAWVFVAVLVVALRT